MMVPKRVHHELIEILALFRCPGVHFTRYSDQEVLFVVANLHDIVTLFDGNQEIGVELGEIPQDPLDLVVARTFELRDGGLIHVKAAGELGLRDPCGVTELLHDKRKLKPEMSQLAFELGASNLSFIDCDHVQSPLTVL